MGTSEVALTPAITLRAETSGRGEPFPHFWSRVVGAGRANEGLRADWQTQLAEAHEACGFEYIRFHGLFHDDMFVYSEREDGTPVLNFPYVDALFDALLDRGVRRYSPDARRRSRPGNRRRCSAGWPAPPR
ncbi:GH39 family glycosyl hydrolase [Streptomyces sp. SBT349]|uniref:GH39 family glycosyl hydrolase n=1 Tax=Streptomyces sp. SBT349 TaxID=1580539 RepID=UPI00066C4E59|nr:hypothetical protein [Streptomyces sp. SBT349]